jgi:hypothetical protein
VAHQAAPAISPDLVGIPLEQRTTSVSTACVSSQPSCAFRRNTDRPAVFGGASALQID